MTSPFSKLETALVHAQQRAAEVVVLQTETLAAVVYLLEDALCAAENAEVGLDIEGNVRDLLAEMSRAPVFNLSPHGRVLVERLKAALRVV